MHNAQQFASVTLFNLRVRYTLLQERHAFREELNTKRPPSERDCPLQRGPEPGKRIKHELAGGAASLHDVVDKSSEHVHVLIGASWPLGEKRAVPRAQLRIKGRSLGDRPHRTLSRRSHHAQFTLARQFLAAHPAVALAVSGAGDARAA